MRTHATWRAALAGALALILSCLSPARAWAEGGSPVTLADDMLVLDVPTGGYVFDGSPKTPALTVGSAEDALAEGVDYDVTYVSNTNAGTAAVSVRPHPGSSLSGTATATFTIAPAPLDNAVITFTTNPYPLTSGLEPNPGAVVKLGGVTLEEGKDYDVTYGTASSRGTASVVGKGNYTGTRNEGFSIIRGHKVAFVDGVTSEVLSEQVVPDGSPAVAPAAPSHEGYQFVGWDKTFSRVTADLRVTAEFSKLNYAVVTFVDGVDGTIFHQAEVSVGTAVASPRVPTHEGFVFYGWTKAFSPAAEDIRTKACYLPSATGSLTQVAADVHDTARGFSTVAPDGTRSVVVADDAGVVCAGWELVGGVWRYADEGGLARTGKTVIAGETYHFDDEGRLRTGWLVDEESRARVYALPPNGIVARDGWFFDGYGWYYAFADASLAEGWQYLAGSWYWFRPRTDYLYNRMATGWVWDGSAWYWMNPDGTMARDRWVWDGAWFRVAPSGAMLTGWAWVDGGWYFLAPNGAMLQDAWTPDGCYVMPNGRWNGA